MTLTPDEAEAKLCPGLGKRGCGKRRKPGQAYCPDDTRLYQRERYRTKAGVPTQSFRIQSTPKRAHQSCTCCGSFDATVLGEITNSTAAGLICESCYMIVEMISGDVAPSKVLNVLRWLSANREVLGLETLERKRARAEEIVYAKWFAAAEADYKYVYGDTYDPEIHQILPSHYIYREGDVEAAMKALHPEEILEVKSRRFAWKRLQHPDPLTANSDVEL